MLVSLFEQACLYIWVCVSGHIKTRLDLASGTLMPGMDGATLAKERNPRLWPAGLKRSGTATSICQSLPLSPHNWTVSFSLSVLKHSRCFVQELLSDAKTYSFTVILQIYDLINGAIDFIWLFLLLKDQ